VGLGEIRYLREGLITVSSLCYLQKGSEFACCVLKIKQHSNKTIMNYEVLPICFKFLKSIGPPCFTNTFKCIKVSKNLKSLFVFLLITSVSFAQDSLNFKPVEVEYAYLNYNTQVLLRSLDLYYSDGKYVDMKALLTPEEPMKYTPDLDNYALLTKAFLYLNYRGYRLVTSSMSNDEHLIRREYVFVRELQTTPLRDR
jgi:hypothetical protein